MQPPRQSFERQNDQCCRNMRQRTVDPTLCPAQVAEVMMCDFVRQDKSHRVIGSAALDKPTRNVYILSRQSEGSRRGKPQYFGDHRRQGRSYRVQRRHCLRDPFMREISACQPKLSQKNRVDLLAYKSFVTSNILSDLIGLVA